MERASQWLPQGYLYDYSIVRSRCKTLVKFTQGNSLLTNDLKAGPSGTIHFIGLLNHFSGAYHQDLSEYRVMRIVLQWYFFQM